jgi:hypothetical protein
MRWRIVSLFRSSFRHRSDEERQGVARLLSAHAAQYNAIQTAFKSAALQRRQTAAAAAAAERASLLGTPEGAARRRAMAAEADVVGAAEGITESLRRTRQMMAEELEHTSATLAAMDASHARLGQTRDEYGGQHGLLKRSRGLLTVINWQQRSETILLWCGLILFACTAAYVAQKRALYFVPEAMRPGALLRGTYRMVKGAGGALGGGGHVLHGTPVAAHHREGGLPPAVGAGGKERRDSFEEEERAGQAAVEQARQMQGEAVPGGKRAQAAHGKGQQGGARPHPGKRGPGGKLQGKMGAAQRARLQRAGQEGGAAQGGPAAPSQPPAGKVEDDVHTEL